MVFEKETNLYMDDAILDSFRAQNTQFEVIQGKISYLITDDEIINYQGGTQTLTSRMNAAEATIDGYKQQISDLETSYDTVSGDLTSFKSTVNTWEQTADRTFSSISSTLSNRTRVWTTQPTPPYNSGDFWIKDKDLYVCGTSRSSGSYTAADWTPATKGRVFTSTPTVPYYAGDMWVQGSTGDILKCTTTRTSGSYNASDWALACKYTDDSALQTWIAGDYASTISDIKNQVDGKAETWYQSADPSSAWTTTAVKNEHKGDLWYCTAATGTYAQKYWSWSGTQWQELKADPPQDVFDKIDGKAQIFTGTTVPKPPYYVGDLWFNASSDNTGDIYTCVTTKETGTSGTASHWKIRNKYTDDSAFNSWESTTYQSFIDQLPNQINMQVTGSTSTKAIDVFSGTYKGSEIPTNSNSPASSWNTDALRAEHLHDLYYRENGDTYQYEQTTTQTVIRFSGESQTEAAKYDYVEIYYQSGSTYYKSEAIGGNDIAGKVVSVPSNVFWLYWHTDSSQDVYYGFSIDSISIEATDVSTSYSSASLPSYTAKELSGDDYPESAHSPYGNSVNLLWKYTASGSTSNTKTYGWIKRLDTTKIASTASLQILSDAISTKVGAGEIASTINQTAQSVLIDASKINLNGYATFTSLQTSGSSTINGDNITTGALNANLITTGTLSADRVMGGTFKVGGSASGSSGKNGNITIYNSSNARIGLWDNSGLYIGNIASNLNSPNFKVDTGGNATLKGATIESSKYSGSYIAIGNGVIGVYDSEDTRKGLINLSSTGTVNIRGTKAVSIGASASEYLTFNADGNAYMVCKSGYGVLYTNMKRQQGEIVVGDSSIYISMSNDKKQFQITYGGTRYNVNVAS